jgi:head-tail adaptor
MRAGDLRQRVTIQTLTQTSDGHDGYTDAWATLAPARRSARVAPLMGRALDRARQVDPRAGHEVTVRYWRGWFGDFGKRARVVVHDGDNGDRVLEPVEPPRESETRDLLTLTCREAA